jgi:hypothetical protein
MLASFFDAARSRLSKPRTFQYACIASGICCSTFFFCGFIAAGFIPPIKPQISAEETAQHYVNHEAGIRVGACLLLFSGMFYIPYSTLISSQIERIPNVPRGLSYLQLASGAAGILGFLLPGLVLAIAGYRPNRDADMTQMLNDAFWIVTILPFTTFITQNWAFAYAIFCDPRPRPLFPRYVGVINVIIPMTFLPQLGVHCVHSGVLSWNGAIGFWIPAVMFGMQFSIDCQCLFKAIRREDLDLEDLPGTSVESGARSILQPISKD